MKLSRPQLLFFGLFPSIATSASAKPSPTNLFLRGVGFRGIGSQSQAFESIECILFLKATRFELSSPGNSEGRTFLEEEKWSCEFDFLDHTEEKAGANEILRSTVELEGIDNDILESQGAKSGRSKLLVSEAVIRSIHGRQVLQVSPTAIVEVVEENNEALDTSHRRRTLVESSGTLKALVIRVIAQNGAEPSASVDRLRSDVFEDKVCLKSQYAACSYGRLEIEAFSGTTTTGRRINGGVVEVKVNVNPSYGNRDQFEAAANKRAAEIYGDLASQFDLLLFSIPPGTGDWLAYAYVDRFDSYYNDKWSSSVSAQVHEVGHSIGLAHSGEASDSYGDQSGMMGFSYDADDAPKMCFNPAKSYQLGWYAEQQKFLNPLTDVLGQKSANRNAREYILNGVDDFQFGRERSKEKLVVLRLKQQQSREDFYLGFNRKTGMNSGTVENANEVIIVKKTGGPIEYGQSWKISTLSETGDSYTINHFDGSSFDVSIELISIVNKDAKVRISVKNSSPCNQVKDSNTLRFKDRRKKNCAWVSRLKHRRCRKTWQNVLLSEWCPLTCGSCEH